MSKTLKDLVTEARNRVYIRISFGRLPPDGFWEDITKSSKPLISKTDVCFVQPEVTPSE